MADLTIRLGAVRPQDAIDAFTQRRLLKPSFRWQDVWQAEHARAFAVAGVMRTDVLGLIRAEVDKAVAGGGSFQDFHNAVKRQLVAKGFWGNVEVTDPATGEVRKTKFDQARLALIFDVNMRQSHAAGRWARIQRGRMPYIVYRTMRDEKVRASHKPWDNIVLPKDHPWWDQHFPPNGWRCRCTAFATDEAGLRALKASAPKGSPVKTEPPPTRWVEFTNRSTGQTQRVPAGIDPGFAYNPGKVHLQHAGERLAGSLSAIGPTRPKAGDALAVQRAVVNRMRSEAAFRDFLREPPHVPGQRIGMPVAVLPGLEREPTIATVAADALRAQAASASFPRLLPTQVAQWALAQAIIDRGARLALADGRVLWWWVRGSGDGARVMVLELKRDVLAWWVQALQTLTRDEAVQAYPALAPLV